MPLTWRLTSSCFSKYFELLAFEIIAFTPSSFLSLQSLSSHPHPQLTPKLLSSTGPCRRFEPLGHKPLLTTKTFIKAFVGGSMINYHSLNWLFKNLWLNRAEHCHSWACNPRPGSWQDWGLTDNVSPESFLCAVCWFTCKGRGFTTYLCIPVSEMSNALEIYKYMNFTSEHQKVNHSVVIWK